MTGGAIAVADAGSAVGKGATLAALAVDAGAAVRVDRTLGRTGPLGAAVRIAALIGALLAGTLPVAEVDAGHSISASAASAIIADRSRRVVATAAVAVAKPVLPALWNWSGRAVGSVGWLGAGRNRAARPRRAEPVAGHALPGARAVTANTVRAVAARAIGIARAGIPRPRVGASAILTGRRAAPAPSTVVLEGPIDRFLAWASAAAEADQEAHDQPTADTPPRDTIRPHVLTPSGGLNSSVGPVFTDRQLRPAHLTVRRPGRDLETHLQVIPRHPPTLPK